MSERVVLLPKAAEDKKVEPAKVVKKPRPVFDSLKRSYDPAVVTFSDKFSRFFTKWDDHHFISSSNHRDPIFLVFQSI